jgi:uncharacterized membrane protein YjgN (DUF898 family)
LKTDYNIGTNNFLEVLQMKSEFTGGLLGLIGIEILQVLIIVFTIGLATPWAVCVRENWYIKHTIIDGKRLYFDGNGGQLFGNYIKWLFFTIITLGIYSFWLSIKMKQWVTSHTHMYNISGGLTTY